MQGKGIVKFFLVLLAAVCLYQYMLFIPTSKVERNADAYAAAEAAGMEGAEAYMITKQARAAYLDSVGSEVVLNIPLVKKYTYEDLKGAQLALGLDLKGGMSTVLQVDLRELLVSLSGKSKDPTFQQALDNASVALQSAQTDYVSLFADEWAEIRGEKRLASIFSRNAALRDEINFESSDQEVISLLRNRADETVDLTFKRLKDRINKFGVTQPNVSLDESRDLIVVELPGIDNPERARNFLQSTAKLEFWNVYRVSDPGVMDALFAADERMKKITAGDTTAIDDGPQMRLDTIYEYPEDSLGNVIDTIASVIEVPDESDPLQERGPLLSLLDPNINSGNGFQFFLPVIGVADENKKNNVNDILNRPEIKSIFPRDMEFRWSAKPMEDFDTGEATNRYMLYMIKKDRGRDEPPLDGERVVLARSNPDPQTNEVQVTLQMDSRGAKTWSELTTKAANDGNREVAILLDDEVVSAPRVNEPITGGNSSISGNFSVQEGQDLANILQIGKLPAKTKIIQESLVGPSLGKENIRKSMISLIAGFSLVLIFMIFYYGSAGIISILALFTNLFFIFGALASLGTVLTLPGIAGIVLTIGMAVDANVIIYERIREELRSGKSLKSAVFDGFKNSYSAIIDANVTTILTAVILAYFGLGPIKGFAIVLIIGVLSSLFTAVLLGRLMIDWWLGKDRNLTFWTPPTKNIFSNINVDWLGKRKIAYVISGTILTLGIISFVVRGFEFGVDFKGGYSFNVEFQEENPIDPDVLRNTLTDVFGSQPVVKAVDSRNTYNITTSYLINDTEDDAQDRVITALHQGINSIYGGNIDMEQFKLTDGVGTHVVSSSKVGPTIADDIQKSSIEATLFALIFIFLYIFIRFSRWQFSLGAVAALFHDTLIVLSIFSFFHGILPFSLEIDQAFIAALLTVIGYSINDTVIVFDRVREFIGLHVGKPKKEVLNLAINSTMSRTVITSFTTVIVILILFIFGGGSIKGFAFAIIIGIVVGTYSSIFIATPIMADLTGDLKAKETKKASFSKAAVAK